MNLHCSFGRLRTQNIDFARVGMSGSSSEIDIHRLMPANLLSKFYFRMIYQGSDEFDQILIAFNQRINIGKPASAVYAFYNHPIFFCKV